VAVADNKSFGAALGRTLLSGIPGWASGWTGLVRRRSWGHAILAGLQPEHDTWSELVPKAVNWANSLNYKYLYYTTGGAEPNAMRIWLSSRSTCNGANGPRGN